MAASGVLLVHLENEAGSDRRYALAYVEQSALHLPIRIRSYPTPGLCPLTQESLNGM